MRDEGTLDSNYRDAVYGAVAPVRTLPQNLITIHPMEAFSRRAEGKRRQRQPIQAAIVSSKPCYAANTGALLRTQSFCKHFYIGINCGYRDSSGCQRDSNLTRTAAQI